MQLFTAVGVAGGAAEFRQFLLIARGSLAEVETLLLLSHRLHRQPPEPEALLGECAEIGRMLNGLIRSLGSKILPLPTGH